MAKIPYDIPSFNLLQHDFYWPISYDEYKFLSYEFVDKAIDILSTQDGDLHIALTCKLSDIIVDITNIARQALDIQRAEDLGHSLVYAAQHSPTCDWLLNSANPADDRIVNRLKPNVRDDSIKTTLTLKARMLKRILFHNDGDDHYNTINFNLLMTEWLSSTDAQTHNLLTEYYINGRPQNGLQQSKDIADSFKEIIFGQYDFAPKLCKAVALGIEMVIERHISQSVGDLKALKPSSLHKHLRKGLVSGTPKYEGRMLSWYFCEHNKDVIRFAHGGERVFYEDYAWPIAELPYCSHYYAHSQAEAQSMSTRLQHGQYAPMPHTQDTAFLSQGSLKHQELFQPNVQPAQNKTLVYVTSVYEHDDAPGLPNFKTPDILYFEFQTRLLGFLKKKGWRIVLKPHPKGLYTDKDYLSDYVDDIVKTPFDANQFEAEAFIFDFAGTAFFDTLATTQRSVLLNLGHRPIDAAERVSLQKRCSVVDFGFDDRGRIELNETTLSAAIENAPKNINNDFIKAYTV
ncbi:MAG: hypothetical protein ACRBDI_06170 [Alphaproteobacteria bacterium]